MQDFQLSTGLPGLDRVFKGIIPGDNLVWQIESLDDFTPFAAPFCRFAVETGRKLFYFRFGDHPPLVPEDVGATVCHLSTTEGFEKFITEIHKVIQKAGRGAFFVFDCLSTLAEAWCSDRMLGNFFMLTCPYVYDLESLAYFPLLRNCHSLDAVQPIADTTQIFLDVYRHQGEIYLHPTKVQHRYSPTMYMLHVWDGENFEPVTESSTIAEILTSRPWAGVESVRFRLGKWNRSFLRAEEAWDEYQRGVQSAEEITRIMRELFRMIISRDERVIGLAEKYFTLGDLLDIGKRMIGTGLIGGKSIGMLLARAILKRMNPHWNDLLEAHDSFYIGSDVFYSFLVENGCWWLRQKQMDRISFLNDVEEARRRILMGNFPEYIVKEFAEMLDYFGQSPIIVRSSSLLEDNYGNAFAGKYESVFCANQGPHQNRLRDFISAVKSIYASTMSEKALRYRAQRGLLDKDEQMPLLVQRVSGTRYGSLFYPHIAGVGLSLNPYVWNKSIDPAAGVVRLVFGLGTRAVDRSDDDYTRVVALNAPERRPESNIDEVRQYSQRKVDVIDLDANQLVSYDFRDVARRSPQLPVNIFASDDRQLDLQSERGGGLSPDVSQVLTFDHLLSQTTFVNDMRQMLDTIQVAYDYPVDLEFTANYFSKDRYKINLLQCRPLQVVTGHAAVDLPSTIEQADLVLQTKGAVIGQSRLIGIDRLVYVTPSAYGQLPINERYAIARLIGKLLHLDEAEQSRQIMLIGPGRWGTTTPSLGVPVAFSEIDTVSVLCEIVAMRDDLVPDVSLGTHFFNDLVEMDILYLALFPGRQSNYWSREFFEQSPNRLAELLPEATNWTNVVRVIDVSTVVPEDKVLKLNANALDQQVVCYLDRREADVPG
jgi:pyruvate, water dikinase